jgi:uncharacterized protein YbjT (DUF2867 family)
MSHAGGLRRLTGMKIAIVGGTGTLGRLVAGELRARGHDVRALSRHAPEYRVDLVTGQGLAEALNGCEVVVDTSNNSAKSASSTLVRGSERLLAAGRAAGVAHHVCMSVVGCEQVPLGYFRVKAEQEKVVESGPVPWTLVRATQFHDYVAEQFRGMARLRVLAVPKAVLQPVAPAEVAAVVADAVERGPLDGRVEIAGPEVSSLRDLALAWRRPTGSRAVLVPLPLPGKLGRALRAGALTSARPDVRGRVTFAGWLQAGQGRR